MNETKDEFLRNEVKQCHDKTLALAKDLAACAANHNLPLHSQLIAGVYCDQTKRLAVAVHHLTELAPLSSQLIWLESLASCCKLLSLVAIDVGHLH